MKRLLSELWRLLRGLPLAVFGSVLFVLSAIVLFVSELIPTRRKLPKNTLPNTDAASVVIPNWNGRDLLEKYLPPLIEAMSDLPGNEIIVVDDGSTDGSADFVRKNFPQVRVLALTANHGFGAGSNEGVKAAKNDIVVLLNSDMRVDRNFLAPLLAGFRDAETFAVSCQIFFSDPNKPRQETGLTEGWWQNGNLHVGHRNEPEIDELFPCFYPGGGSSAYDRRKFLEVGGFEALFHPFYLEDAELGYLAWKRGWKALYQPKSVVFHEHRGTIGKSFSQDYIDGVLRKNWILFTWKNIHNSRMLAEHFLFTWGGAVVYWIAGGGTISRPNFVGIVRAVRSLPAALRARSRAKALATISDEETFRRPLGGHFRDTFATLPARPEKLNVLFVSPYPICPPIHGGGVFMFQTVRELAKHTNLHLIVLLDHERERAPHAELDSICASTHYITRLTGRQKAIGSAEPHAPREFRNRDLAWLIHRFLYMKNIDVLQLEYTVLGQYAGQFRRSPSMLFEHDVYFQSIARRLPYMNGLVERMEARWEYLRALRYELKLLPRMDRVQVCTRDNADYLLSFLPQLQGKIDDGYRAGIATAEYDFHTAGREPFTLLFLGSFRHLPNVEALQWFLKEVFPLVRAAEPRAKLVIVGSDPPPRHSLRDAEAIEMIGFVEDVREPLGKYSAFVCPILAGSGIRVKLLEAFAAGIPVVSTRIGAEGLAIRDGEICALADDSVLFAHHVVRLLQNPKEAAGLAERAPCSRHNAARHACDDREASGFLSRGSRAYAQLVLDLQRLFQLLRDALGGCIEVTDRRALGLLQRAPEDIPAVAIHQEDGPASLGQRAHARACKRRSLARLHRLGVLRLGIQFLQNFFEILTHPIGEHDIGFGRIGNHLKHGLAREMQRKVLIQAATHRSDVNVLRGG
ncbi:MAG: glycosyltransferase [Acidobacteriota bacterium]